MKRELHFYALSARGYFGAVAGFAAIVLAGLLLTRDAYNLFGMYARMFPFFALFFSLVFALSSRTVLRTALSFGAGRRGCFAAAELVFCGLCVFSLALAAGLNAVLRQVPQGTERALPVNAVSLLLAPAMGFAVTQLGLLAAGIESCRRRALVVLLAVMGLAMATIVVIALTSMQELPFWENTASPLWAALGAALTAAALGMGFFAARQYKKAVVQE